jgi:putative hydrolase of the HAD superfamily
MPEPPIRRFRAVSFDLDGTLYSVRAHTFRIGWKLLRHRRLMNAWESAVASLRGSRQPKPRDAAIARMAVMLGRPPEEISAELTIALDQIWTGSLAPSHVLPGIPEAIALLDARGIPRSVASDHPPLPRLRRLGLDAGWVTLESGEELGAWKPLPDVLEACAAKMGVLPTSLLHLGDREDTDGQAARAAGAAFLQIGGKGFSTAYLAQILDELVQD